MSIIEVVPTRLESLESAAPPVLKALRRSVAAVVSALPSVTRAVGLAEALHLDRSLAWKLWRIAQSEEEYPSPKHIPGRQGVEIFLKAAERAKISADAIEECRRSFQAFDALTNRHAGDRASADIMLGSFTTEGRRRLELSLRRGAFRGNSHFLGVQTRVLYQADAILPAEAGYMPAIARLRGFFGLRRLRSNAAWVLGRGTLLRETGPSSDVSRRALHDGVPSASLTPMVPEFCSMPLPEVTRRQVQEHTIEDELAAGPVGQAGAVNILTGELFSHMPRDPAVERNAVTMLVSTPAEALCFDVLLHKSVARAEDAELAAYTMVNGSLPHWSSRSRDRIPMAEPLANLGSADGAPAASEVPNHAAMLSWLFKRLPGKESDYTVLRLRMKYPPMPVSVAVSFGLVR